MGLSSAEAIVLRGGALVAGQLDWGPSLFGLAGMGTVSRVDPLAHDPGSGLNVSSSNSVVRGVSIDGEGNVWATLAGTDEVFRLDAVTGQGSFLPMPGDLTGNYGDATGYLLAHIIHPNEDFDLDGVSNLAELQAGQNPFRP